MEMYEKTPYEEHSEELKAKFTILVKNRNTLCDEKGNLKKENMNYSKAYIKLLNDVNSLIATVASDLTTRIYCFPKSEKARLCIESIKQEYAKMQNRFIQILKNGSYEELEEALDLWSCVALKTYVEGMSTNERKEMVA